MGKTVKIWLVLAGTLYVLLSFNSEAYSAIEKVSNSLFGKVICMKGLDGKNTLYVSTQNGLYSSLDNGANWQKIDSAGGASLVADMATNGDEIIILKKDGVYAASPGEDWKNLLRKNDLSALAASKEAVIAWRGEELFIVKDNSIMRAGSGVLQGGIDDALCFSEDILVVSGGDCFWISYDGGITGRISLLNETQEEENGEQYFYDDEVEYIPSRIAKIDSSKAAITTSRGVCIVEKESGLVSVIDTTGLPSSDVRYIAFRGGKLFVSTKDRIFYYDESKREWILIFEVPTMGDIVFLESHTDRDLNNWIWTGAGNNLYRINADLLSSIRSNSDQITKHVKDKEPSIREVQEMAIEYAEVSPEKIKKWRNGAKWKALLPRLSVDFSGSRDNNIEVYKSATSSYVVTAPEDVGNDWGIDLTWELSDLIWNGSQTSIDVRSRLMGQLALLLTHI